MVHKDTDIMVRLALTVHLTNTNEPLKWGCTYTQDVSDLKFIVDYNDARFFPQVILKLQYRMTVCHVYIGKIIRENYCFDHVIY